MPVHSNENSLPAEKPKHSALAFLFENELKNYMNSAESPSHPQSEVLEHLIHLLC